ncbi:hypothetical protein KAU33_05600, partial [Candidatus Dependentiae bacterium]|nr:hypothetical protein [Candidatus Dependentiae bacterium]
TAMFLSHLNHMVLMTIFTVMILIAWALSTKLSINSILKEHTIINSKSIIIISSLLYFIFITIMTLFLFSIFFITLDESHNIGTIPFIIMSIVVIIILTVHFIIITYRYFHKYRYGFVNDFVFSDFIKYGDKIILKANYEMFPKIRKYLRKSRKSKDEIKEVERTANRVDLSGFHEELRLQENLAKLMKFNWDIKLRKKFPESQFEIEIGSEDLNYYITYFRTGKRNHKNADITSE